MIINRVVLSLFCFSVIFAGLGCTSEVALKSDAPVCIRADSLKDAMNTCEDVLVKMHFTIEKFDPRKAYIKTRPLRGGQFFEFWRNDNAGFRNAALSNVHSILRTVELQLTEKQDQYCIECTVHMRRLSIKEEKMTRYSFNDGIFFGGSRSFQKLRPEDVENLSWIDIGPDTELEERILGKILYKVKKSNSK